MEQVYEVVSKVEDYKEFLPACNKSLVRSRTPNLLIADLEIGLPPFVVERYTSHVTLKEPTLVAAKCLDGKLFHYLNTEWRFSDGLPHDPHNTCMLDFRVEFEFRSQFHAELAHLFFDEMVRQSVNAFLRRTRALYGPPRFKSKIYHITP